MFSLKRITRKNILALKPYSSARSEFNGEGNIFLDANENPWGKLNRYPDPKQGRLKEKIAKLKSVSTEQIFIGNGSDEAIDLLVRIFCEPRKDKILLFSPSYGMYEVAAAIQDVEVEKVPLKQNFQIDFTSLEEIWNDEALKIIFICSPNNPTGNSIEEIDRILNEFNGIVVVDEAYIDFSTRTSWIHKISNYPNLVVLQTFSKAWGLAAARVGMAFANPEIIDLYDKVKPPYNVSSLNQNAALSVLEHPAEFEKQKKLILEQRIFLVEALTKMKEVKKIFSSETNFILIQMDGATAVYDALLQKKLVVRNRSKEIESSLRITVGTAEENRRLIKELKEILDAFKRA